MFGFHRKPKVVAPDDVRDMQIVPVDLNAAHTFAAPSRSGYHSAPTFGANPYAPEVHDDLPTIKDQDAVLLHYMQPPAAAPPQGWYDDRNAVKLQQSRSEEYFQTAQVPEYQQRPGWAVNPWQTTEDSNRVTSHQSPSNYRFARPFDQRFERSLNGKTGSMAVVSSPYPIGGMLPARNLRNTIRLSPPDRDTENYDLSGTSAPAVVPAVYVSPDVNTGRRYGL